jgi:predicted RNA-binding Zn-ribbon protein involved in translation (DUF1610 family)
VTLMPSGPSSSARFFDIATSAALLPHAFRVTRPRIQGDDSRELPASLRRCEVLVVSGGMPTCPYCQQSLVTRDGHDRHDRRRYMCTDCGRDFTLRTASAFSGYRWPADVILMAVRWYLRHPLSATSHGAAGRARHLAERGRPTESVNTENDHATLKLRGRDAGRPSFRFPWAGCNGPTEWRVHVNPRVASEIRAHTGGGNVKLNRADMIVTGVSADTGGGNMEVVLPDHVSASQVVSLATELFLWKGNGGQHRHHADGNPRVAGW